MGSVVLCWFVGVPLMRKHITRKFEKDNCHKAGTCLLGKASKSYQTNSQTEVSKRSHSNKNEEEGHDVIKEMAKEMS